VRFDSVNDSGSTGRDLSHGVNRPSGHIVIELPAGELIETIPFDERNCSRV
jgi:hypothetical protein